ncbi:mas-related G-protein coupled receptor member H-like [Passerculus sandwichensis]
MSPPAISRTEGDDLCETDVPSMATHSVTLPICLCDLAGNGAVLWVLGFRIHRDTMKPITAYNLDLALINFLFLIFMVPSTLLFLLKDIFCSSIMPPASIPFLFLLFRMFHSGLSWVVVSAVLWALSITAIAAISAVNSLCQSQEHKFCCRGALISLHILSFLVFAPSMVISSTILFIHFKGSSQQQQYQSLDITVFLAVLLTLPLSLWNFLQQLSYTTVSPRVVLLFACMHSSISPFIYISVTKCWRRCSMGSLRECLQKVFEEPEGSTAPSNDATMDRGV